VTDIDEKALELLAGRNFATVSTLREDGAVHSVYIWINVEDGKIRLNTADGRFWLRNVERDPRVTILVADAEDQYAYVMIRGRVVDVHRGEDALPHIDRLSQKYHGYDYRGPGKDRRVKLTVQADRVVAAGG
jgi:PPOX class probable F420-dependent enzyme